MTASAAEVEAAQKAAGCRWESGGPYGKPYCGRHQYVAGNWLGWTERGCEYVVAVADAVVAAAQPRIAAEATHGLADKWNLRANWLGDEAQS